MRDLFSDRREPQSRPRRELRNKISLDHHIKVEHGVNAEGSYGDLRGDHDALHASSTHFAPVPHDHGGPTVATCPSCLGEGRIGVGAGYSTRECDTCGGQGKYEV